MAKTKYLAWINMAINMYMTCLFLVLDFFMTCSWLVHIFASYSLKLAKKLFIICWQLVHNCFTTYLRLILVHDLFTIFLRLVHYLLLTLKNLLINCSWNVHNLFTIFFLFKASSGLVHNFFSNFAKLVQGLFIWALLHILFTIGSKLDHRLFQASR